MKPGFILVILFSLMSPIAAAAPDKAIYLELARQGWSYELRTTMLGRDLSIPVRINGGQLAGASLCIVGDKPHAETRETLNAFSSLIATVFGRPLLMRYAGPAAEGCGTGRIVMLRLYSGRPPNQALSADLEWMNEVYALGLQRGRSYAVMSPAMAQTFFGRRGSGTHIMVQQPSRAGIEPLEMRFFRSILIEELYQSFSFGMDILHIDRALPFQSKLEEAPLNLQRLSWDSEAFMKALLRTNPEGLCAFDVFMLHAVAAFPLGETNDPAFIDLIEMRYDELMAVAGETLSDPRLAIILDPSCVELKG